MFEFVKVRKNDPQAKNINKVLCGQIKSCVDQGPPQITKAVYLQICKFCACVKSVGAPFLVVVHFILVVVLVVWLLCLLWPVVHFSMYEMKNY